MTALRRIAWAFGLVGATITLGFVVRTVLLGGVDGRGQLLAIAAAITLCLYAWLDRERLEDVGGARKVQRTGASVALVVIAAVAATVTYAAVRTIDTTIDLTQRQQHALSAHSEQVLASLPRDVTITAFFPHGSMLQRSTMRTLQRYADASPRVHIALVDPLAEPLKARAMDVTFEAGEVVLTSADKVERLMGSFDEHAISDALVRVTSDRDHIICWSEGHGEASADDTRTASGMGAVISELEGQNYQVMRTNVLAGGIAPECEVVVIARPTVDFLGFEIETVHRWVLGGGRLFVLLEPGVTPVLAATLRTFGLAVGDDLVLDADPNHRPVGIDDPSFVLVPPGEARAHPITRGLAGPVLLGVVRSVGTVDDAAGVATRTLLHAGVQSWAERDIGADPAAMAPTDGERQAYVPMAALVEVTDPDAIEVLPSEGRDVSEAEIGMHLAQVVARAVPGARALSPDTRLGSDLGLPPEAVEEVVKAAGMTLGVQVGVDADPTVQDVVARLRAAVLARLPGARLPDPPTPRAGGRIVAIGDASFAGNRNLTYGANRSLFLDSIAFLADELDQLGERPATPGDVLEISAVGQQLLGFVALLFVPLLSLAMAWRARQRRQGA